MPDHPLLQVSGLSVDYRSGRHKISAVSSVDLALGRGRTLGLVGESGSGKTTIGRAILGLVKPTAGQIVFDGEDRTHISPRARRRSNGRIRAIFQDPYSSLNPALPVVASLLEALPRQTRLSRAAAQQQLAAMLGKVGLDPAIAARYPGRLSGGQRQRVAIARALVSNPELIICDEPVTALDVSIQAQILNLLRDLQRETGVGYLFISHDLDVVRYMADDVAVLYRGELVETGDAKAVTENPGHAYTRALIAATPQLKPPQPRLDDEGTRPSRREDAVLRAGGPARPGGPVRPGRRPEPGS